MHIDRSALVARLEALRLRFRAAGNRAPDIWNDAVESFTGTAGPDDNEWLTDRINDVGHEFGIPGIERAQITRQLDSLGQAAWDDPADESNRPRPFFTMLGLRYAESGAQKPSDVALRELAAGGGLGSWTWGYDYSIEMAWFSDARRGATTDQIDAGFSAFRAELARLGLVLAGPRKP